MTGGDGDRDVRFQIGVGGSQVVIGALQLVWDTEVELADRSGETSARDR